MSDHTQADSEQREGRVQPLRPALTQPEHEDPRRKQRGWWTRQTRRPHLLPLAIGIVAVLTIAAGTAWWLYARCCESTDDAFISARAVAVAAQVSGAIVDVHVTDNELVGPGASLARVDDR